MSPGDAAAPAASGRSDITDVALVDRCADLLLRLPATGVRVLGRRGIRRHQLVDGNADLGLLGLVDELVEVRTDPCTILLVRPDAGRSCLDWVAAYRGSTKRAPFKVVLDAPLQHRAREEGFERVIDLLRSSHGRYGFSVIEAKAARVNIAFTPVG